MALLELITVATFVMAGPIGHPVTGPDGSELLRACTATVRQADGATLNAEDAARSVWCVGYVGGFLDGLAVMNWRGGASPVCLPQNGIENEQAVRIVVKYLRNHPEQLHESGRIAVVVAIGEAFKCSAP